MTYKAAIAVFGVFLSVPIAGAQSLTQPARNDSAIEKPIAGTIKAVATFRDPSDTVGVHLDLLTEESLVNVHVAPAMFIGQNNFSFAFGDQVEIVGTRTVVDGNTAIWATTIQKGQAIFVLRNADGTPKWTPPIDGTDGCGVNHIALPRGTER